MMGHDISGLMISPFAGNERDEFGKEKNARLPLLLPKVMEGRPIASNSPFLGLPPEILGDIMDLIADDQATLAALALVNSDCRQLARSCQFADVCFDYGKNSTQLLLRLLEETRIRLDRNVPGGATRAPFVGSCIRRVTVRPRREWVIHLHTDLYDSIWGDAAGDFPREQRDELRKKAAGQYIATFRTPLLISLKQAMPNLESLSLCDGMCLDDTSLGIITHLPIRHLKLSRAVIGEPFRLEPPLAPSAMPLESLCFGARLCNDELHKKRNDDAGAWETRTLSPFIATLLQRCSATLRHLSFTDMALCMEKSLSFGQERIVFNRLRHLNLAHSSGKLDAVAWSSLLSAPLRHLALPFSQSHPIFREAISTCRPLRDLETLVVPYLGREDSAAPQVLIDFIARHPHVSKLSVSGGAPRPMDSYLLPCLSDGRWSNLASLSLAWDGPGIEETTRPNIATIAAESLAAIGSIESLEQLCLSAGVLAGWRHQWLIDHNVVRSSLRGLTRLKKLAFSRDTYMVPGGLPALDVEGYYVYPVVTSADRDEALEWAESGRAESVRHTGESYGNNDDSPGLTETEIWEYAHRKRMIQEAEKYAAVFQELEWIYCGQWPMDIRNEQTSRGVNRFAVPLGESRDSCWTLLRRMFEMEEDDE